MTEIIPQAMPVDKIIAAITKAMGAIKPVAKDSRNTEQKYDFASIDNFLALVNPICADAGLIFHMEEIAIEALERQGKYNLTSWLSFKFAITVMHVSGQSLPPVFRTVEVIRTGAQSAGSAQSYALKQFLRSLFLIPTGDNDDADFAEKGDGPVVQQRQLPRDDRPATPVTQSSSQLITVTQASPLITVPQGADLCAKIAEAGVVEQVILDAFGLGDIADMRQDQFVKAMAKLELTIRKNAPIETKDLPY